MAGAMRKVGEYLGLVEQADFDDEFDDDIEPSVPDQPAAGSRTSRRTRREHDERDSRTVALRVGRPTRRTCSASRR